MPERQQPDKFSGAGLRVGEMRFSTSLFLRVFSLASIAILASSGLLTEPAFADGHTPAAEKSNIELLFWIASSLESFEILMIAIFGGAMSFALLSAFWLIRQRASMVSETQDLKRSLADLRVSNDRNEALVSLPDQRVVVWSGPEEQPILMGSLSSQTGAPEKEEHFLRFGHWIDNAYVADLKSFIANLRENAQVFDMVINTRGGGVLEVVGSTTGNYAVVKFLDLSGVREDYARLKTDHENLSRSFDHIEGLLTNVPMPVWLRDKDGQLSWVNQAYADALEVDDPIAVAKANMELFDSEQRDTIESESENDKLYNDLLPATVAGDRRKLQVFNISGKTGSAGIAIDKSDVEDVRRVLKETNEGNSRMLDQMATAVAIFDKQQRLVFHNGSFQQLWKLDPGMLEDGPSNGDILDAMRDCKLLPEHPDWRKWRESQLEIYTAIEPVEDWWHLLDGQTIRVVISPRSQGGSTWVFENVTERLALESNYNSLMRVQGETLDHLNEAVAVFGSNGQLKLFNPALEELLQDAQVVAQEGLHISRIIEKWSEGVGNLEAFQHILGSVTGFDDARNSLDGRMELKDDRTIQYSLVPLPDSQTMLTFVDVSASVNLERALRERAEALEASDLLKGKFIQHVSYELRAPLTSISGFGEILKMGTVGTLNEKQDEYLSHINSSAFVLRNLVDDILDLASIDAGTMTLDLRPVELEKVVRTAFQNHAGFMHEKSLKCEVDISQSCETIVADEERLLQIIGNLISNAINFSPDAGTISVGVEQNGLFNEIRIMDQGPGIEPSEFEVIFDRFETQPTASGKKGTGLGLSIVQGFVDLHGGEVLIDPDYDQGSCFVCRLPINPQQLHEPEAEKPGQLASVA